MCLLGLSKAHSVVLPVKDSVVLADEYISQNPQGAGWGRDIQSHKAAQTNGLSSLTLLEWEQIDRDKAAVMFWLYTTILL